MNIIFAECAVGKTRDGCSRGWSAGRAARACAARAALRARLATALLLDEPAAALDAPAERTLLSALATQTPNITVLTVAVSKKDIFLSPFASVIKVLLVRVRPKTHIWARAHLAITTLTGHGRGFSCST